MVQYPTINKIPERKEEIYICIYIKLSRISRIEGGREQQAMKEWGGETFQAKEERSIWEGK